MALYEQTKEKVGQCEVRVDAGRTPQASLFLPPAASLSASEILAQGTQNSTLLANCLLVLVVCCGCQQLLCEGGRGCIVAAPGGGKDKGDCPLILGREKTTMEEDLVEETRVEFQIFSAFLFHGNSLNILPKGIF